MCVVFLSTTITISPRLSCFVLKHLEKTVEQHCEECTEQRSHPVDPMIAVEAFASNVWTERTGWIERCASVEHTYLCQCL